jgi:hypothetical protein
MLFPSLSKEALDITVKVDDHVLSQEGSNSGNLVLVGAIDQGTSSTRFLVFTPRGEIASWAQMEHTQVFPEGEDKVMLGAAFTPWLAVLVPCMRVLQPGFIAKSHQNFLFLFLLIGWLA